MKHNLYLSQFFGLLAICLFSISVWATKPTAAPDTISFEHFDLSTQDKSWGEPKWKDGRVSTFATAGKLNKTAFNQLDEANEKGQAASCISASRAAVAQNSELGGWIIKRELQCLESAAKTNKTDSLLPLSRVWKISENSGIFEAGPWAEPLKIQWKTTALAWIEYQRRHNQVSVQDSVNKLLYFTEWLNNSDRARLFGILGDRAFLKQNLEAAKFYLDRSLQLEENGENRTKLSLVEASISKRAPRDRVEETDAPPMVLAQSDESTKEKELDARVANSMRQNDPVTAVEDGIELITTFPNGTRAKTVTDKIYESFATVADKSDPKYELAHTRALTALKKADGVRLQKWAQSAYRGGLYADSAELADAALKKSPDQNFAPKLLWLAARGAQQSGDLKTAEMNFKKIIENNTGSDEFADSLIQLGIINLSRKDWATATTFLERATIRQRDASKDLTAKYWLWRALQKTDGARAKVLAAQLADRYPLSYYGLRARAEANDGNLKWPLYPEVTRSAKIFTSKAERQGFARLQKLYELGWWEEAQGELRILPDGVHPSARALMVKISAAVFDYPRAISQFNKVMESDPTLAQDSFLRAVYPRTFFPLAAQEAQTRKLDPLLVLSLMRQESAFNPHATSSSGALGLMQMIPPTVKDVQQLLKVKGLFLPDDMYEPRRNIQFCTYYLSRVINEFDGTIPLALASYNAGPARLKRWIQSRGESVAVSTDPMTDLWMDQLPWDETQFYVKAILRNWILYRLLDGGPVDFKAPFWLAQTKIAP